MRRKWQRRKRMRMMMRILGQRQPAVQNSSSSSSSIADEVADEWIERPVADGWRRRWWWCSFYHVHYVHWQRTRSRQLTRQGRVDRRRRVRV